MAKRSTKRPQLRDDVRGLVIEMPDRILASRSYAAQDCCVSGTAIAQWIDKGWLAEIQRGGRIWVDLAEVRELARKKRGRCPTCGRLGPLKPQAAA